MNRAKQPVAPRAGAWIETSVRVTECHSVRSPLAQGRGLKHDDGPDALSMLKSPLAQGRGLKLHALTLMISSIRRPSRRGVD